MSLHLTLAATSSDTDTAGSLDARIEEGSAYGGTLGTSAQEPGHGERIPQVPARQRARSHTSSAAEESNDDFNGPSYRRRLMGIHDQMLGNIGKSARKSAPNVKGHEGVQLQLGTGLCTELGALLSHMEWVVTSISTPVEPTMLQRLMTDVTASIAAQIAAIHGLTAAFRAQNAALEAQTAAIVALGTAVERGVQDITAGQQPVLQQITRSAEAPPQESDSDAMEDQPAVPSQDDSIPAPTPATLPVPLLLHVNQPGQTAAA
ncbi:uncharacterized protein [Heptranchias perlo]|uniref:uncharacterized protein n=1 Tax=Heptranchias perlo TaxID=212740 RepID=UPI00355A6384